MSKTSGGTNNQNSEDLAETLPKTRRSAFARSIILVAEKNSFESRWGGGGGSCVVPSPAMQYIRQSSLVFDLLLLWGVRKVGMRDIKRINRGSEPILTALAAAGALVLRVSKHAYATPQPSWTRGNEP